MGIEYTLASKFGAKVYFILQYTLAITYTLRTLISNILHFLPQIMNVQKSHLHMIFTLMHNKNYPSLHVYSSLFMTSIHKYMIVQTYLFLTRIVLFRRNWKVDTREICAQFCKRIYTPGHIVTVLMSASVETIPFFLDFLEALYYTTLPTTTYILLLLYPTSKQTQRPRMDLEKVLT